MSKVRLRHAIDHSTVHSRTTLAVGVTVISHLRELRAARAPVPGWRLREVHEASFLSGEHGAQAVTTTAALGTVVRVLTLASTGR